MYGLSQILITMFSYHFTNTYLYYHLFTTLIKAKLNQILNIFHSLYSLPDPICVLILFVMTRKVHYGHKQFVNLFTKVFTRTIFSFLSL